MLDLRAEEPRMALILIECLYLGRYTDYKEELRSYTTAQRLWLREYFNERIVLWGGDTPFRHFNRLELGPA